MNKYDKIIKIIFMGNYNVGKTSLICREVLGSFTEQYMLTIGAQFIVKQYNDGQSKILAQFWDTAGQQKYRPIQAAYYRKADIICLCFDLNNKDSFQSLTTWVSELQKHAPERAHTYLIGCKSDLKWMVSQEQVLQFAQKNAMKYAFTSARNDVGVSDCFSRMIHESMLFSSLDQNNKFRNPLQRQLALNTQHNNQNVYLLVKPNKKPSQKTSFCKS